MYRFRNSFCLRMMVLAGVLVFGTPAGVLAEEADHSMEGQISKPQSSGESDTEGFVDDSTDNTYGYYTIMGCTTVDAEDMVVQYEAQNVEYPSGILTEGGAPDIDTFCTIVIEEADAEGVRGEVVFEQAMLETGWLQFGGDASAVQFNFSGLGTTGGGVAGNSFPDVRTGIRAQVQHLKAYASSEELNQACVDNRFQYVTRESAPYVEWLGIQENPYGGGWAAGRSYGYKLRSLLAELKGRSIPGRRVRRRWRSSGGGERDGSGRWDGPEGSAVLSAAGLRRRLDLRRRDSAKTIFQKPELAAFCRSDSWLLKNNAEVPPPKIQHTSCRVVRRQNRTPFRACALVGVSCLAKR